MMKTKIFASIAGAGLLLCGAYTLWKEKHDGTTGLPPEETTTEGNEEILFQRALAYGDLGTAAVSAHRLALERPEETRKWQEELAKIYFTSGSYDACVKVCADIALRYGGSDKVREWQALALEGAARKGEALEIWKDLFEITANPTHAVRLAGLQFEAGDLAGARITIDRAMTAPEAELLTVSLPKTRDELQNVPAAAALQNLKGLLAMKGEEPDRDEARKCFESALALLPDFELARRNLQGVAK